MPKLLLLAPTPTPQPIARLQLALLEECALQGITAEPVKTHWQPEDPDTQMVTIALCTEHDAPEVSLDGPPLVMLLASGYARACRRDSLDELGSVARAIFATEDTGVRLMADLGYSACRVHCGYTAAWDAKPRFEERDIDIVVHVPIDALSRRQTVACERFSCLDLRLLVIEQDASDPRARSYATELFPRAKVFVALRGEGSGFHDVAGAILAGSAVVAEHGIALHPLRAGEDILFGEPASLPYLAGRLLSDRSRRLRMSAHAYMTLRVNLPLRDVVATLHKESRDIYSTIEIGPGPH
ncbi:MAG TPA: hypothetical protein VGI26_00190 [Solirubrobacteraceae bacterium]